MLAKLKKSLGFSFTDKHLSRFTIFSLLLFQINCSLNQSTFLRATSSAFNFLVVFLILVAKIKVTLAKMDKTSIFALEEINFYDYKIM